jgi:hypothetical protein
MIAYVTAMGAGYNPEPAYLKLAALQTVLDTSASSMDSVIAAVTTRKAATNFRENTFSGIRRLTTRIVNYYAASGAEENHVEDARSLKRKIDGKRAETLKDDPNTPEDETKNSISVAQTSYTQLVEHFNALVAMLDGDPLYKPNEEDLKVATLEAYSDDLSSANTSVINALVTQSNARGARDIAMYAEDSGLVDTAMAVKKYVKAAFGTDSLQYAQIKGLAFTRPNEPLANVA